MRAVASHLWGLGAFLTALPGRTGRLPVGGRQRLHLRAFFAPFHSTNSIEKPACPPHPGASFSHVHDRRCFQTKSQPFHHHQSIGSYRGLSCNRVFISAFVASTIFSFRSRGAAVPARPIARICNRRFVFDCPTPARRRTDMSPEAAEPGKYPATGEVNCGLRAFSCPCLVRNSSRGSFWNDWVCSPQNYLMAPTTLAVVQGGGASKRNAAVMQYKDVQFSLLTGIVRGEWRIVIRWPNGTALDRSFRGGKTDAVRGVEGIIDRWLTEHGKKRRLLASVE